MIDTIFALSSGPAPAAIGVIRVSGPDAGPALERLAGPRPAPRVATLRRLRDSAGALLDEALVLWFPGPASATGEDCAELHCHGGRAVLAAVLSELHATSGLREGEPGEFTRRAFENGRIDLAQAEALADLLAAETELQRRVAQAGVGGALSNQVGRWRDEVLTLSAIVEAFLDFNEDDDIHGLPDDFWRRWRALCGELTRTLALPRGERLREGVRVVIAGPPNSGKSSLFNALIGEGAAIVSDRAGTTRDVLERSVAFSGVPFVLIDTAGLRERSEADAIEVIGMQKAQDELDRADVILWLGSEGGGPEGALEIEAKSDDHLRSVKQRPDFALSSKTGLGLEELVAGLVSIADTVLPGPTTATINARQADLIAAAARALEDESGDPLIIAEALKEARRAFDKLLGNAGVEDMLDALFGRFCIGK